MGTHTIPFRVEAHYISQLPSGALFSIFFGKGSPLKSTNQKRLPFFSRGHWASEILTPVHVHGDGPPSAGLTVEEIKAFQMGIPPNHLVLLGYKSAGACLEGTPVFCTAKAGFPFAFPGFLLVSCQVLSGLSGFGIASIGSTLP